MADSSPTRLPRPSRAWIQGTTLGVGVLLSLVLLVLVNYFAWKYYKRFDWTSAQLYTLSEKSLNVARGLDQEVTVTVLTSPGAPAAEAVEEILDRYQAVSDKLTVRTLDPVREMLEAQQLLDRLGTSYLPGSVKVVFESESGRRVFEESDFSEADFASASPGAPPSYLFTGEETFTSALVELASGERRKVLFVTGHGEGRSGSFRTFETARDLLGRDNVQIEDWASRGQREVPEGTALIIVAGPTSPFLPEELDLFRSYLEGGGRMLLLLDPVIGDDGALRELGLESWLQGFGVAVGQDLLLDPDRAVPAYGAETVFVADFASHPVVEPLRSAQVAAMFQVARSVGTGEAAPGYEVTELAFSSANGWGETDLETTPAEPGGGDTTGPVPLGVAVQATDSHGGEDAAGAAADEKQREIGMRLVAFGDSDYASDAVIGGLENGSLLYNAFAWLLERERFMGIAPKKPEQVRLVLTGAERLRIYLLLVLLPLAALIAGVVVHFKRRR